jgi:hypothetical protein
MNATDATTYQARLRARRAELAALAAQPDDHRRRSSAATARSAKRWQDDGARPDQERRAGLLRLAPATS